jgi:hypothetical protein
MGAIAKNSMFLCQADKKKDQKKGRAMPVL